MALQALPDRFARQQIHDQEGRVVGGSGPNANDMRATDRQAGARFAADQLAGGVGIGPVGSRHLDGDAIVGRPFARRPDAGHRPAAEGFDQLVAGNSRRRRHIPNISAIAAGNV